MEKGYGISEEIIGHWLQRTGRRDDIVLATKVYQPMGLGPNDRRLSAYHIRRACEASLRRLQPAPRRAARRRAGSRQRG
jgi:aryl-alcohol dehydrogenase-like predicted oxidoreductase